MKKKNSLMIVNKNKKVIKLNEYLRMQVCFHFLIFKYYCFNYPQRSISSIKNYKVAFKKNPIERKKYTVTLSLNFFHLVFPNKKIYPPILDLNFCSQITLIPSLIRDLRLSRLDIIQLSTLWLPAIYHLWNILKYFKIF